MNAFKVGLSFIILTLVGLLLLPELSLRLNPSQTNDSVQLSVSWPGASPLSLEQQVTRQLESGVATLQGIKKITSRSLKGYARIKILLDDAADVDQFRFEVSTVVRQLYQQFPEEVRYPQIRVNRSDDEQNSSAFMSFSIAANGSRFAIQEKVNYILTPAISALQDIDQVKVYGAMPEEWVINFDRNQLNTLRLSKQDLIQAISRYHNAENLGRITNQDELISVVLQQPDSINWHIPVKNIAGRIIYLDEIADFDLQEQAATSYYRVNAKNAINMAIYPSANANTIDLSNQVDKRIDQITNQLPGGYSIEKTYDATQYLSKELDKIFQRAILTVTILLLFVLLISGNFRYLLHIVIGLITTIGSAFILYYAFNVEIQLYSLAGITLSLGLTIDNLIVSIDHLKNKQDNSIFIPVLASTLTSIGSLSVIYFLDEEQKANLIDFAYVMIINLAVSLLVAMLLVPALFKLIPLKKPMKLWQRPKRNLLTTNVYQKYLHFAVRYKRYILMLIVLGFGIPTFMLPSEIDKDKWYAPVYNNTLGTDLYQLDIRPYLDASLGGAFRLFSIYVFENSYYSRNQQTTLQVKASMQKGATIEQMNEAFLQMENFLLQFDEIKNFKTTIYGPDYGRMEIFFEEAFENSGFPYRLKARLTARALDLGGMKWNIYGVGKGFYNGNRNSNRTNFRLKATGYNYDQLNAWADTLKQDLLDHPRIEYVEVRGNSTYPKKKSKQYQLAFDKEKLQLYKAGLFDTYNQLASMTFSRYPDNYLNINGKYMPVRMASANNTSFDIWDVKNQALRNQDSQGYNLSAMADIREIKREENVYKEDQEYIRLVEFQYTGSNKFGQKYLDKCLAGIDKKLPVGYQFKQKNSFNFFGQEEAKDYTYLLLLIAGIIFIICAVLFESFKQPLIILSIIPVSFIGVFLTFYLFDFNFDQGGLASFLLLSGLTVNASIFIINDFNALQKNGQNNSLTNYNQAFHQKITPIFLTVISTVLGFIPFVYGGQDEVFWFALGVGVIGGLLFSILMIVFILPVLVLKRKKY